MNCRGNFHAGFALPFIAATASCRVSLTREYSSHKNSLSSSSCPAGPIARREICMCHSFVSVWQGTWSYVGWIRTRKARRVGRTFRNQSIGDVPQDFLFRRLHTRRSVKNFSLSFFLFVLANFREGFIPLVSLSFSRPSIESRMTERALIWEKGKITALNLSFSLPVIIIKQLFDDAALSLCFRTSSLRAVPLFTVCRINARSLACTYFRNRSNKLLTR